MKKKIISIAAIVLSLIFAVVGTIAYFTDRDDAENTFTIGNIKVQLVEQEREYDEQGQVTGLKDFTNDKLLMPIVGSAQGEKDAYGMPIAKNYVDKIISVKNTGKNAEYVRVTIGEPKGTIYKPDGQPTNLSYMPLHGNLANRLDKTGEGRYNTPGDSTTWNPDFAKYWDYQKPTRVEKDGYVWTTFVCKIAIAPDEVTPAIVCGYYLDKSVDYDAVKKMYTHLDENGNRINFTLTLNEEGKLVVPVYVEAIQADGFATAAEAFAAYDAQMNPTTEP